MALQSRDWVYIPEWDRGVFSREVERVEVMYGRRYVKLVGHDSWFEEVFIEGNQDRWRAVATSLKNRVRSVRQTRGPE